MIDCSLEFASGSLDYDGRTWGGTPIKTDTDDYLFEIRTLLGGNIYEGNNKVTPFIGFGLRYWNDTIQGAGGYEREILYLYSAVGMKMEGPISDKWSWSFTGEYDLFWKGWVTSHLCIADTGFNDPEYHCGYGTVYGVWFSFSVPFHISEKFSGRSNVFQNWDVDPVRYAILLSMDAPMVWSMNRKIILITHYSRVWILNVWGFAKVKIQGRGYIT
jgi:hypothetical protein